MTLKVKVVIPLILLAGHGRIRYVLNIILNYYESRNYQLSIHSKHKGHTESPRTQIWRVRLTVKSPADYQAWTKRI